MKIWLLIVIAISPIIISVIGILFYLIWRIRKILKEKVIKTFNSPEYFTAYFFDSKNNIIREPLRINRGSDFFGIFDKTQKAILKYDIIRDKEHLGIETDKKGRPFPFSVYRINERQPINLSKLGMNLNKEDKATVETIKNIYETETIPQIIKGLKAGDIQKMVIICLVVIVVIIAMFFLFYHPQCAAQASQVAQNVVKK
jgi:hypothetical protein